MVSLESGERVHGHVATRWKGRPAVLTLTDRRLVVSRTSGLPRRTDRTLLSVEWASVTRTSVESAGRIAPLLVLETRGGAGGTGERVELPVDEPLRVQRSVDRLVEASLAARRRAADERERQRPPVHVHLTVHQPGGAPGTGPVYVRCSYCRTVYREIDGKCPSCGAPF